MFTFVDLFAGIGGTRLAFAKAGGNCVFASEWDKHCQVTYETNFGVKPQGDIKAISEHDIPDHDILLAGFPRQPFSIAGVSKISVSAENTDLNMKNRAIYFLI
jgi:DNA (cytosine-5)-methyltransferase 1